MKKTLVILRHAHRNTDVRSKDNGLSDKGLDQVKKMLKFSKERLAETAPVFYTSPKKRCIETITPVAEALGLAVEINELLDESGSGVSMNARIEEFIDRWKYAGPETTVICSHGDWIPYAVEKLTGAHIDIKKCGWIEIEYENSSSRLNWMIQKWY